MLSESTMEDRYHQLHLHSALSRRCDYSQACKELASILRRVYARAPKGMQHALCQDVLSAFRLLPGMDTNQQLSAADVLLQAVEATLPKKRRTTAVSEYKQAAVAQHRRARHEDFSSEKVSDFMQLSTDMLLHILGFLDPRSLAMSSAVCRTWNKASNDDRLWRTHFLSLFGGPNLEQEYISISKMFECRGFDYTQGSRAGQKEGQCFWRTALAWKLSQPGRLSRLIISNRALCMGCKSLFWLSEPPGMQENKKTCIHQQHTARPVTVAQVLSFVLREPHSSSSSSSSDSETDEGFRLQGCKFSRLWAYPRLEQSLLTQL